MGNVLITDPVDRALYELFRIYDIGRNGWVTLEENVTVGKALSNGLGLPFDEKEWKDSFKASDANKDGKVTWEEFRVYWQNKFPPEVPLEAKLMTIAQMQAALLPLRVEEAITDLFNIHDIDKNGYITMEENITMDKKLSYVLGWPFDEEASKASFGPMDANKDGKVTLKEFKAYAQTKFATDESPQEKLEVLVQMKAALLPVRIEQTLTEIFNFYDIDKSGLVSMQENVTQDKKLSEALGLPFDEEESKASFIAADADKDGKVNLEEFLAYSQSRFPPEVDPEVILEALAQMKRANQGKCVVQ